MTDEHYKYKVRNYIPWPDEAVDFLEKYWASQGFHTVVEVDWERLDRWVIYRVYSPVTHNTHEVKIPILTDWHLNFRRMFREDMRSIAKKIMFEACDQDDINWIPK